jgi:hypothetical protein
MDHVSAIPIPALTLVTVVGALIYNAGFFSAVGFHFINLFSIQEHLVFALTGSAVLVTLTSVAAQVHVIMVDYYRKGNNELKYYFAKTLYIAGFVFVAGVFVINASEDAGPNTAALAGLGFMFAAMLIFILPAATIPALMVLFGILETFTFGSYYGNFLMFRDPLHTVNWAKSLSGERFRVLRVGRDYSLLISSSNAVMVALTTDLYLSSDQ